MAKLTHIKKIVNSEVINIQQLISNLLYGSQLPNEYSPDMTYSKGDIILNNQNGVWEILVCLKDGIAGEFTPEYWQKLTFTDLFKDSTIITQNNAYMQTRQESLAEDLATLVFNLAGLLDNTMEFNNLYIDNFKTADNVNISVGVHEPGSISSVRNSGIDFTLLKPFELKVQPEKFKLKHIIELTGLPELGCEITFNALDARPFWFSANDAILSSGFFTIPEDFEKEDGVPYAMNIRIFGTCDNETSIKISDLMVVIV
jgi:hypothetical protein